MSDLRAALSGIVLLLVGGYTLLARHENPTGVAKMRGLQDVLGDRAGYVVHAVVFSVVPLLVGALLLKIAFFGGGSSRFDAAPSPSFEEQAEEEWNRALDRLMEEGLSVQRLPKRSLVAREPGFTAGIAKADAGWSVVCPKREPIAASSLERATQELLECRAAASAAETPPARPTSR